MAEMMNDVYSIYIDVYISCYLFIRVLDMFCK